MFVAWIFVYSCASVYKRYVKNIIYNTHTYLNLRHTVYLAMENVLATNIQQKLLVQNIDKIVILIRFIMNMRKKAQYEKAQ